MNPAAITVITLLVFTFGFSAGVAVGPTLTRWFDHGNLR
jgi:hypothetical protein